MAPIPIHKPFLEVILAILKTPNYGLRADLVELINNNLAISQSS
jgi:hypothetical protein